MNLPPHIKKITIPAHIAGLATLYLAISGKIDALYFGFTVIGWILISGFGIAVGFHRLLSHNSFETTLFFRNLLAYLGCLGGQGSPIFWVSVHRGLHHPFADTQKDLHSPIHGKWSAYLGWQFRLKPTDVPFRICIKMLQEPFMRFLHKHYEYVVWGTFLCVSLIDWKIALTLISVPMLISIHQENAVDLFCHLRECGYRNFETEDQSVNNIFLGYFAFGQGWHNNHHAFPEKYDFGGIRWYEFDPSSLLIRMIARNEIKQSSLS